MKLIVRHNWMLKSNQNECILDARGAKRSAHVAACRMAQDPGLATKH